MRSGAIVKRCLDVIVAAVLLLVTLPVIVTASLITMAVLRTSPFFTQTRIGRNGEPFKLLKIRTLPKSTPRYAIKYDLARLRVPKFSLMLRRLHLDELPQLLLVLTGKMSLVGPRPEMPNLYGAFEPEFADRRVDVRPGCTGLWQISEHCDRMIFEHPEFDRFYLDHRTLRLDLRVLLRSVRLLLPFARPRMITYEELVRWAPTDAVIDLRAHSDAGARREPAAVSSLPELQSVEA